MTNDEIGVLHRHQICAYIQRFSNERGYAPTVRDIGKGVGLRSTSTVQRHLDILRAMGRVSWVDGCVRTLKVIS